MKTLLVIAYIIVAIILTGITLMQTSDEEGASATITGGSSSSFYDKNKGRTAEGKLKKLTIIFGIAFIVLCIILSIFY